MTFRFQAAIYRKNCEKFGVPALAGSCAALRWRNPTKVGTPNATQNLSKLLLTCLIDGKGGRAKNAKRQNGEAIFALAESWSEMSESDFEEYLSEAKRSGGDLY